MIPSEEGRALTRTRCGGTDLRAMSFPPTSLRDLATNVRFYDGDNEFLWRRLVEGRVVSHSTPADGLGRWWIVQAEEYGAKFPGFVLAGNHPITHVWVEESDGQWAGAECNPAHRRGKLQSLPPWTGEDLRNCWIIVCSGLEPDDAAPGAAGDDVPSREGSDGGDGDEAERGPSDHGHTVAGDDAQREHPPPPLPGPAEDPPDNTGEADRESEPGPAEDPPADAEDADPEVEVAPEDGGGRAKDRRAEARSLSHKLTRLPKNPFCEACQTAKMKQTYSRRGAFSREVGRWGQSITCDRAISRSIRMQGLHGETAVFTVRDLFSGMIGAYPVKGKDSCYVVDSLKHFAGRRKLENIYSDSSGELIRAVKDIGGRRELSVPGVHRNNSIIERANQIVIGGTTALLIQAGLPPLFLVVRSALLLCWIQRYQYD